MSCQCDSDHSEGFAAPRVLRRPVACWLAIALLTVPSGCRLTQSSRPLAPVPAEQARPLYFRDTYGDMRDGVAAQPRWHDASDPAWQPRIPKRGQAAGKTTVTVTLPAATRAVPVRFGIPLGQAPTTANVAVYDERGRALDADVFPLVDFRSCPLHWVMMFGEIWQYTHPYNDVHDLERIIAPARGAKGNLPEWYKPKSPSGIAAYRCGDAAMAMAYAYLRTGDQEVFKILNDHVMLYCDWAIAHPEGWCHYYCLAFGRTSIEVIGTWSDKLPVYLNHLPALAQRFAWPFVVEGHFDIHQDSGKKRVRGVFIAADGRYENHVFRQGVYAENTVPAPIPVWCPQPPVSADYDGKKIEMTYDADLQIARLLLPAGSKPGMLTMTFASRYTP